MLNEDSIQAINDVLELCGAVRLNASKETAFLDAIGTEINGEHDVFKTVQIVLLDRLSNQTGERNHSQLNRLKKLADSKGIQLSDKKPVTKKATVRMFGFGIQ